jgi:hypothetical protein
MAVYDGISGTSTGCGARRFPSEKPTVLNLPPPPPPVGLDPFLPTIYIPAIYPCALQAVRAMWPGYLFLPLSKKACNLNLHGYYRHGL